LHISTHYSPFIRSFFFLLLRPPPRSTLFPYTTLFRSQPPELPPRELLTVLPMPFARRHLVLPLALRPDALEVALERVRSEREREDRKSTRLNSSHVAISYAVFCLKKKKNNNK